MSVGSGPSHASPFALASGSAYTGPMPRSQPPLDIATLSIAEIVHALGEQRLPPVERWTPAHCGDSEMRIARDGTWFHQGSPIVRKPMVQLFAQLLRREADGGYVLVTPAEKLDIAVEDAPFVAVELRSEGAGSDRQLVFRLNTDDLVVAGPSHPLHFIATPNGDQPYLVVRKGLDALISRSVYYELVDLALAEDCDPVALWSGGAQFLMVTT